MIPFTPASIFWMGRGTPMTPVELTSTRSAVSPNFGGGRGRHAARAVHPLLTVRHVAALAVGDDRREPSPLDGLTQDDRRARKMVAREDGGVGLDVAHEQREVARGGLEADVTRRAVEAPRKARRLMKKKRSWTRRRVGSGVRKLPLHPPAPVKSPLPPPPPKLAFVSVSVFRLPSPLSC